MRASLSKSDNALSSLTSVINGRVKRHHSIDDDYPLVSTLANEEKKIHVHFHPDLISSDHRVPLVNDNEQQIIFEKSLFSSELVVSEGMMFIGLNVIFVCRKSWNGSINLTVDKKKRC